MSKKLLIAAFDEPNHTQTPNALFDILPELGDAELRVILVMIRYTLGYHREQFKMGISKLAEASGLSEQGARNGAQAAEGRGFFRRVNPDDKKEATWELILRDPNHVDPQPSRGLTPTTLTSDPNHVDHIPSVKENIKENINKTANAEKPDLVDAMIDQARETAAMQQATNAFESALGFGVLDWDTKTEWRKFRKFVIAEYKKDPQVWKKYAEWRKTGGKYDAMSNPKIRQYPQMFMDTGFPTFLASVTMYGTGGDKSRTTTELLGDRDI